MCINDFLKSVKAPNDPTHTHVSMGIPRGVFSVGVKMNEFWQHYIEALNNKQLLHLAENPGKEIPILVDIDLKEKKSMINKSLNSNNVLYTYEQVKEVVKAYQNAITEVVDFNDVKKEQKIGAFTCVLLEKKPYEIEIGGEIYIKNGFHLHFPKIFLDKKVQEVYIIPKVKNEINNLFKNGQDAIDVNSINVHWLLYGSKKQNKTAYEATKCFLINQQETSLEEALGDYQCNVYRGETKQELNCRGRVHEMLPRILSIFLYDRKDLYFYNPKSSVSTPLIDDFSKIRLKRKEYDQLSVDKALEEAQILIGLINSSRADERATWLRVGFCLWNITHGDDKGMTLWLEFSEQSDKFNESECLSFWQSMRPNNFTIGTLKYYARKDSPEEYEQMIKERTDALIQEAIKGSHNDVAKIFYSEYGNEFVCVSISNKTWYQFKNHIWHEIDTGKSLRERISSDDGVIIKRLKCKQQELSQLNYDNNSKLISAINKLIQQCKQVTYKNHVMIECQEIFYKEPDQFRNLLNKDPYIIAFKNGIYDFNNDNFRDGNPEDYLSSVMPIEYIDYYSLDHPEVMVVDDFFQKVFPDREIRDYFLDQVCQVFVGGNHNKVILFWTGDGNNGKTVTQTLFEKMLGKLAIKFNTTLITGKKTQTGAANPELARAGDGIRWAVMEEPNPEEMISAGILKGLTGNDSFWARDLFQKGKETREITPMFKLHMICNKLPPIRDADKATWNRIRVIPFESTFVTDQECPFDIEDQIAQKKFPMDKNFTDKIPKMIQPLAWYLIQRWKTVNKLEQVEPDKVKVATDVYMEENDIYKQFERQCIFTKKDNQLTPAVVCARFKDWYKEECPNQIIPSRNCIRKYFTSSWGDLEKNKYWLHKTCNPPLEEEKSNPLLFG